MKVQINGKPVTGEASEDEPPPQAHVLKRLIGETVHGLHVDSTEGDVLRIAFKSGLSVGIHIVVNRISEDTHSVELGVGVET